jgi:hypothetical protein
MNGNTVGAIGAPGFHEKSAEQLARERGLESLANQLKP